MIYIVFGFVGNVLMFFFKFLMIVSVGVSGVFFGIVGVLIMISGVVGGNM